MVNKNDKNTSQEVLQEDRYLWMARAFSIVALLSFIAIILMIVALSGLTPLLRVQPFWIRMQAKDNQAISIVRPSADRLDSEKLQEALARDYLINRYTITSDPEEMERVWGQEGPIAAMSSEAVYRAFRDTEVLNHSSDMDVIRDVKENGLTRTINFTDFGPAPGAIKGERNWEGRISMMERSLDDKKSDERSMGICVWMRTSFAPESENQRTKTTWAQRFRNPLGFKVIDFAVVLLGEDGRCQWSK